MSKKSRSFSAEFKAQVGLEAPKGIEPIHVIAQRHEVHPVQVSQWKKEVTERLPEVFAKPSSQVKDGIAAAQKELYARIGQLQIGITLGKWTWCAAGRFSVFQVFEVKRREVAD